MRKNEMDAAQKALAEAVAEGIREGQEPEMSREEKAILREAAKAEKENTVYTSFFETDHSFVEEILHPIGNGLATHATHATDATDTRFILYDKLTGTIDYLNSLEYKGKTYKPIETKSLSDGVISLPTGIEEYGETSDLIKEIHGFLYENFEAPPFYQAFLPYIVLFSWVYERFPFVPYVHFVGLTGTGKTTAAEAMASICYKTCDASGSITLSPLFRMADQWRGTLFLDEFEPDGDNYKEMIAMLKAGVGNRAVLRTEGDKKKEVMAYLLKSMKIFTGERPIPNAGLRSRIFVIEMKESARKIPLYKQRRFFDQANTLRNKLLLWRLRNLNKIDLSEIEYGYPELAHFDRRVQQVVTPIYYLSDEESRKSILEFAKTQEKETKLERAQSFEGEIFQAIIDQYPASPTLKSIAETINKDRGRRPISDKKIANIIRQVLQFDIKRIGHENINTVMLEDNPEQYEKLQNYFGIMAPVASVASVADVASEQSEPPDALENATDNATDEKEDTWTVPDPRI